MKRLSLVATTVVMFLMPAGAHAYVTTGQDAVRVTGSSAIYLIEFEFGHGDHEIHIPVFARDTDDASREFLSYGLFDDENRRVNGITSAGIVLANAPIEDGRYIIPAGESRTLTLLVIASVPTEVPIANIYSEVTYLPFSFDGENELQLNPSELQYYRTPSLVLPIQVSIENISTVPVN